MQQKYKKRHKQTQKYAIVYYTVEPSPSLPDPPSYEAFRSRCDLEMLLLSSPGKDAPRPDK